MITEPQRELGRKPLSELSVDGVNLLTQSGGILAFQGSPPRVGGGSTTDVTIIARFGGNRKGGEPNLGVRFTEPFFFQRKGAEIDPTGFEPVTLAFGKQCSIPLSYGSVVIIAETLSPRVVIPLLIAPQRRSLAQRRFGVSLKHSGDGDKGKEDADETNHGGQVALKVQSVRSHCRCRCF